MTIDIDTSRPIRTGELAQFVVAVSQALQPDESTWIEWKSPADLMPTAANRMPDDAEQFCGGMGYIVIGADPEGIRGVPLVDPAVLHPQLRRYTGARIRWHGDWVHVRGVDVLVVTVDAPRWDDPIWPLEREFDSFRSGRVFVRHPGASTEATANELHALQRRHAAPSRPRLDLSASASVAWIDSTAWPAQVDAWVARLLAPHHRRLKELAALGDAPISPDMMSGQVKRVIEASASATRLMNEALRHARREDGRTVDEYRRELQEWEDQLRQASARVARAQYLAAGHGVVHLTVTNGSDRFLHDVEIRLELPDGIIGVHDTHRRPPTVPDGPRPYGPPSAIRVSPALSAMVAAIDRPHDLSSFLPQLPVDHTVAAGRVSVRMSFDTIRQFAHRDIDEFTLLVTRRPPDGRLVVPYTATIRDPESVINGAVSLELDAEPIIFDDQLVPSAP